MLSDRVISEGSLRGEDAGWSFEIRMPWYRALPLSCFVELTCAVDGRQIDPASVTVETNGTQRRMEDLPPLHDEWWFVADASRVHVDEPAALAPGDHELDVTVAFRIPYIVMDGNAVVMRERCVKVQPMEGAA
jgi:Domain of unknown function (DUF6379)